MALWNLQSRKILQKILFYIPKELESMFVISLKEDGMRLRRENRNMVLDRSQK